jgi:hypothetical protein
MPAGSWIQFRYAHSLVAPQILSTLRDSKSRTNLSGAPALIVYLDQATSEENLEFVPCRLAKLATPVLHGQTVSLELELQSYLFAEDVNAFKRELERIAPNFLPRRRGEGTFWFEIDGEPEKMIEASTSAQWEQLVGQIAPRIEFKDEPFFYAVESLQDVGSGESVLAKNNVFSCRPNQEYEVRIYHFHPDVDKGDPQTIMNLTTSHPSISFTTNPEVILDSRYDLKRIRFQTGTPPSKEPGVLTLGRKPKGETDREWEFDLRVQVKGSFPRKFLTGLLIGALLAVTPVVAALNNPNLPAKNLTTVIVVSIAAGIATGMAASFGLKRSL